MHSTAHNHNKVIDGAPNSAVREDIIKINPFTRISSSDKIHKPESKREHMTVDEVRKLIATPMQNQEVKAAYLSSCFCGLRISDIIALKWESMYQDGDQIWLEVVMQKPRHQFTYPSHSKPCVGYRNRATKDNKTKCSIFRHPQLLI